MVSIAGVLDLHSLMGTLSQQRPVFHSEADFQFAFAQAIATADPTIEIRLEVRQASSSTVPRAEHVDLACWTPTRQTLIEFKYATAGWTGADLNGERYHVRNHAAYDLARRYFIRDIHRLERFTTKSRDTDGAAIMLTNEPSLWTDTGRATARDSNFRVHQGRTLTGHLAWGTGRTPQYDQHLSGTYTTEWHDYSRLDEPKGQFRWLAVDVDAN